jgi:hypothetical protein
MFNDPKREDVRPMPRLSATELMPLAGAIAVFVFIMEAGTASAESVPFPMPTPRYMEAPLAPLARLVPMSLNIPEKAEARSLFERWWASV